MPTKALTDWFTAIANSRRTPPVPEAIPQNARVILSLPKKERDLFFKMLAGFVRDFDQRQATAN